MYQSFLLSRRTVTPIALGRAGSALPAEIAYGKFCLHLPLHLSSGEGAAPAFAQSSKEGARIGQFEMALENIGNVIAALWAAYEMADTTVAFARRKPARPPLPEHLPRVQQVYPNPSACPCCAGRLRRLGQDITETLERVPASADL